jgi:predicted pyridoxine 5'-phosphate oxidase superfamily flavin-nucleotide-binding protein
MITAKSLSSDIAFTPTVKALQMRKGSRASYARLEEKGSWRTEITPELKAFIEAQISVFLATVNGEGQPYIQHRGGPAGFLRVIDERTIAFVDFAGNRQYITQGNLSDNAKAHLFLIDYAHRKRVKIWGKARVVEGNEKLVEALMPEDYRARPEQVILFRVLAWDTNCSQHIPQLLEAAAVVASRAQYDRYIAELEAEVARLRTGRPP